MIKEKDALVAIMNDPADLAIARDQHWYRIPVASVHRFLKDRWPPKYLAFYQTQVFGNEAFAVNYYAQVLDTNEVSRKELFPEEKSSEKTDRSYYKLTLSPLEHVPHPIQSRRLRRIVFIPTTVEKLANAVEINDLYNESPLEDHLWAELKLRGIHAERQEFVQVKRDLYALDFAIYCADGKLDIETDGDTWHSTPERTPSDNQRQNDLVTAGWKILRFNTKQVNDRMEEYCVPTILENIHTLGGMEQTQPIVAAESGDPLDWQQLLLFDASSMPKRSKRKKRR